VLVVEIVDLDAAATECKVFSTLKVEIPGDEDDQAATAERQAVQIPGLWPTRSGLQIATARMNRATTYTVTRIPTLAKPQGWNPHL